jgi:hypothetical protein
MNLTILMLALTTVLVLRSGERIVVDGTLKEERGVVVFRSSGVLYSLPAGEIASAIRLDASDSTVEVVARDAGDAEDVRKIRVSNEVRQRLIAELEKNHSGTPAPPLPIEELLTPPPTREQAAETKREEWSWRRQARAYEESIRQARENLALLEQQTQDLESKIHSLLSLGFKPQQFSYDTTLLVRTREQIPAARLAVTRAERAWDEFREDARRQGILPGWLR